MVTQHVHTGIVRRQSLSASISKACPHCNAPGVFQNSESFIKNYPEIYRPAWAGKDVGRFCPCCGHERLENKDLGEIWSKEWRLLGPLGRLVEKVKSLIKKR